jgi:outer membrane protein OmpA-like peptidoglycan-associated protein
MRALKILQMAMAIVLVIMLGFSYAEDDYKGCSDHPMFSRIQDFYISSCKEVEYDSHDFYDETGKKQVIEGHKWRINYKIKKGLTPAGVLKIKKNYIDAVKKIGGQVLKEGGHCFMRVDNAGRQTWLELNTATTTTGDNYSLIIVQTAVMAQEVVADPDAMASNIHTTGHFTVYGIYFDHDSYAVKSESEPALKSIAEMLKAHDNLKVYVVGHTDATGEPDYNMELSRKRAQAVADQLVAKYSISPKRLKAQGVGSLSPISTNRTEEGRKLNRRVELVEMGLQDTAQALITPPVQKHTTGVQPSGELETLLDAAVVSYNEGKRVEAVDHLKKGVLSIWDDVPLTIKNVWLVEDMKTYETRKNNTFGSGEKMHFVAHLVGYQMKPFGDSYSVNITTDVYFLREGEILAGQQNFGKFELISPIRKTDFQLELTYWLTEAPPGDYDVQTVIHDQNSGQSTKFTSSVKMK